MRKIQRANAELYQAVFTHRFCGRALRLALPIAYTIQDYSLARVMILVTYLLRCKLCHLVEKQSVYRNPMRKRGI